MAHRLEQIAAGGANKLPPRLLAPARELLAEGREPARICLVVAAWLRRLGGADGESPRRARSRRRSRPPSPARRALARPPSGRWP